MEELFGGAGKSWDMSPLLFPRFLPSTPLNLVEKEVEKSQNRISLRMRTNELLGAKDDFRITRSYLTPQGVLHLEVPSEMLDGRVNATTATFTSTLLPSQQVCVHNCAADFLVVFTLKIIIQ